MSETTNELATAQYLTFRLAEEIFGLPISVVREVLDYPAITRIPRMPQFLRGVINLRGAVVPVVDLRVRFDLPAAERTARTCVIIAEVAAQDGTAVVGLIADAVEEVLSLGDDGLRPAPRIGMDLDTSFIQCMGTQDDRFITVLAIDRLFPREEVEQIATAA